MYSWSSVSKRPVLVPILAVVAIQLLLIRSVTSLNMTNAYLNHKCMESQGKYKPGSEYEKDMKSLTLSIVEYSKDIVGYVMRSISRGDDMITVILQCRGDSYGIKCRECYTTALAGLRRRCPKYKGAMIWYDQCLLDISAIDSEGKIDYNNNFCMSNAKKVVDHNILTFDKSWNSLIDNLTTIAVSGQNYSNPSALYAVGERRYKKKKLYGMVQCTLDISPKACEECVLFNILHFQDCLLDKRGARVVGRSCNFRFEFYPFVAKTGPIYLRT